MGASSLIALWGLGLLATDIAQDTACDGQSLARLELYDPLVPTVSRWRARHIRISSRWSPPFGTMSPAVSAPDS
jgi:hypothetical protein